MKSRTPINALVKGDIKKRKKWCRSRRVCGKVGNMHLVVHFSTDQKDEKGRKKAEKQRRQESKNTP